MASEKQRDQELWILAKKRIEFRRSVYAYIAINGLFWAIWWVTEGQNEGLKGFPWPLWVMVIWGIVEAFQYYDAFGSDRRIEKEYNRLNKKRNINP